MMPSMVATVRSLLRRNARKATLKNDGHQSHNKSAGEAAASFLLFLQPAQFRPSAITAYNHGSVAHDFPVPDHHHSFSYIEQ